MRIAFVSDIHGNLAALEAVVHDIRQQTVDTIFNLGDSLSGPLLPLETAQYLMAEGWASIAGNHERQLLTLGADQHGASDAYAHNQLSESEVAWIRSLPPTATIEPDVFLCHGTPSNDLGYFLETTEPDGRVRIARPDEVTARIGGQCSSLIVCGHTHIPRVVRAATGQMIVNPGSVGLPAYEDHSPFPHLMETGSPDARYAIVEERNRRWHVTLRTVPYDHAAMARLAKERNRPDWERALNTGYAK
jgi:predicted phosphodiesterase